MKIPSSTAIAFALTLSLVTNSAISNVIDQESATASVSLAGVLENTWLAQSFQQASANVSGAGIRLGTVFLPDSTDPLTISLRTGLPGRPGTELASATTQPIANQWVDVFWSPVSVIPGTTYFLVFSGPRSYAVMGNSDEYPRGNMWHSTTAGPAGTTDYDFSFRTFASNVPESNTLYLLASGLLFLGVVQKKR